MDPKPENYILYIEDDPEMIDLVSMILTRHQYHVKGANGGREGLTLMESSIPDLVLLDLMMPDLDGWDVFRQIKSIPAWANVPVIIITAKAQDIDRVLGLQIAKVDDYICKPFRPQELLDSIKRVLSKQSQTD
ncbi:MAG TPA: response regulator [Anaerolineaceae bacterium]